MRLYISSYSSDCASFKFHYDITLVLLLSVFTVKFLPVLTKLVPFNSLASSYLWTQLFMPNAFICTYLFGIVFGKYDIFSNLRHLFSGYTALLRAVIGCLLIVSAF